MTDDPKMDKLFFSALWEGVGGIGSWEVVWLVRDHGTVPEEAVADVALGVLRRFYEEGWFAFYEEDLTTGSRRELGEDDVRKVLEGGTWAAFPPGDPSLQLEPTKKWDKWRTEEESKL